MKANVHDIARAFVDLAGEKPESERTALIDAAVELLHRRGLVREARMFPERVARLWRKRSGAVSAVFTTPVSDALEADRMRVLIEKGVGRPCMLAQRADAAVIGGAVLRVEDEQFDYSVRTALRELAEHVSDALPTPAGRPS